MNIVKQSTGNVVLTDAAGNIQKVFINVNALDVKGTDEVIIKYGFNQWHSLFASQIDNTQVEPAAAVPFSGNAFDLVALLSSSFFFELSGGGGSQDLASVLSVGNSANGSIIDLDYLDFDTAAGHTVAAGELAWNDALGTLNLGLKGGSTISNLGQHLHARVVNKTTPLVPLTKAGYEVVIVSGATGQRLSVKKAQADNDANSAGTLGVVCENIAVNQEGFICSVGQVTNINTTGSLQGETWADGDMLYLSGTTAGAITNVKPSAPIHEVRIGYVEYAHPVNGKIYVKIDNGYEISELHDVAINPLTLANNDVLTYESSTQLWKNKPFTNAEGWSVIVKSANQDVTNSATLTDDTELQFSVVAGGQYMVELDAVISSNNTTGDYTNAFFVNSGTMKGQGIQNCNTATALAQVISVNATSSNVTTVTPMGTLLADIDLPASIKIIYSFTASANAVFSYRFANAAAAAGRTSRTWKGSILKYKKIN